MKLWINFEEKDIKKRTNGWSKGDDWESQVIFEQEQNMDNCDIYFSLDFDRSVNFIAVSIF
jgi:hypothetical protein